MHIKKSNLFFKEKLLKKALATLCLLAATSILSFAQVQEGNNFEVGAGYHFASITSYDGYKFNLNGPGAHFEYRYEDQIHLNFGGRINYKYAKGEYYDYEPEAPAYDANLHQICVEAFVGYTFLADCIASPFVGVGIGCGGTYINNKIDNSNTFYFFGSLTPRVGVQLWKFRLGFNFDILSQRQRFSTSGRSSYKIYSTICSLNLGFTF